MPDLDAGEACLMAGPSQSPPGKPELIKCRSFEKVTFSCWWKPGSDGGLPTNYSLLYRKEIDTREYECPDYKTSGPNSCYFHKNYTSFWMNYYITIKATNALGSTLSDTVDVDTAFIVETYPPINVTLVVEEDNNLLVKWKPPAMADVRSGWLTLQYEVRLKEEKAQRWENHTAGNQLKLKVFGLNPEENYVVQVRCKPDSGFWSEWSAESYIQIPGGPKKRDLTLWISLGVLSSVICITMIWTMALKGCSFMSCIFPPVPGPKIMGFDTQLLKSGKSEDLLSAFGCQGFPPTSDCEDLLVEFVEVDDSKQHLMSSQEKGQQSQHMKVGHTDTDNDSGRGSCDSPFALSEGCKELRINQSGFESADKGIHDHSGNKSPWPIQNTMVGSFSNFSDNKSYVWPEVSTSGNQTMNSSYHNITDVCKLAIGAMNANKSAFLTPCDDKNQPRYFKTIQTIDEETNTKNDLEDMHCKGIDPDTMLLLPNEKPPFMTARTVDYVEVHKVNQNNALSLIPKHTENSIRTDQYSVLVPSREYTKVERVEGNNVLVLMQDLANQANPVTSEATKMKLQQDQAEKNVCIFTPAQNEVRVQMNAMGYLDPSSFIS
ncbi:prolactin receptor [Rhinophrynus dorsalis]